MEFKVGDNAVVPNHGVGVVTDIRDVEVAGETYEMYIIEMIEAGNPLKFEVPVNSLGANGVREVIEADAIERIYDILRDKDTPPDKQTWNRRYREYTNKIKTGDPLKVAAVLRDLCRLKTEKTLSFGERKMFDLASSLIIEEVAVSRGVEQAAIEAELDEIFTS